MSDQGFRVRMRRGAAILPSLFTTGNLFLGFWAIIKAVEGRFEEAAPLIAWAMVLDVLDGLIARMTGTTSEFGGELDSLADVISFGVAPAILAYLWALSAMPRVGWLVAFLFVMCSAMRLARFNVQRHVADSRFFIGLPTPAAAGQVAAVVFFSPEGLSGRWAVAIGAIALAALALLMVSTWRYPSLKGVDVRRRRSYLHVLGIAMVFLLIASHPKWVLLGIAISYTASAPLLWLFGYLRRRSQRAATAVSDTAP